MPRRTGKEQAAIPKPKTGSRAPNGYRVGFWHGKAKQPHDVVEMVVADYQRGVRGKGYASVARKHGLPFETVRDWVNGATRGIP